MLKYESIYQDLLDQIQKGDLAAGAKLPSVRNLSGHYSCNVSTILTALRKLEGQHLVYSIPKSGYYVVDHQVPHHPAASTTLDFATSSPTWHGFPYKDFQHCMNKAIDTYQADLFEYGTLQGLPSLIAESQQLLESYQVFTKPQHIFVTSGVQRALAILSLMPFPNGGTHILVEQPSYHLYIDLIKTYRLPAIGIKRTAAGIDLDELEQIFRMNRVKFFYTMPRLHNPLGTSYSLKEKKAILQLAHKYNVYIVEDDYLADFEPDRKVDPLFSQDVHDRVIYLKSFSKIMFPGLRIGLTVLPANLTDIFIQYKISSDIDSSMISQAALELYLKSGMFERYRKVVSEMYITRAKILQRALQTYLPAISSTTEVCMHSHIVLPKQVNLRALIGHLQEEHILVDGIERNYLEAFYQERILKLNVTSIEDRKIEDGIRGIAAALENRRNYF